MGIVDEKSAIFGQLSALKTLNEGLPSFKLSNSLPSISNDKKTIEFLIDLLKVLIGYEELRNSIVDILTTKLDAIEIKTKVALKKELKGLVSCGVDPSIPNYLKNTGAGFKLNLKDIDVTELLYVDPTSQIGDLLYDDVPAGLNSTDFNTFLFNTVQSTNTPTDWGSITSGNDILNFNFNPSGSIPNELTIKASTYYSNPANKKTLTDLNTDFIDSIDLFPSGPVITKIIDSIFGTISAGLEKSAQQLEREGRIEAIVNKIVEEELTKEIDDSFFSFTNEETEVIRNNAFNKSNGVIKLKNCGEIDSAIPLSVLESGVNDILASSGGSVVEQKTTVNSTIKTFGDSMSSGANNEDKYNANLNFIELLIKNLVLVLVNTILTPKIMSILALNYFVVHGENATLGGPEDFLLKNRELFRNIASSVQNAIIDELMKIVIKEITSLIAASQISKLTEKANAKKAQLLSLVGVPIDIIRIIQKLS